MAETLANSEYQLCHAKGFCPFRLDCSKVGNAERFSPASKIMKKNDLVWSHEAGGQFVFVIRSGVFVSFVPFEDGTEPMLAIFSRGVTSGITDLWVDHAAGVAYGLRCIVPGVICKIPAQQAKESVEKSEDALTVLANIAINTASCALELTRIRGHRDVEDKLTGLFYALRDMARGSRDKRTINLTNEEIADLLCESRLTINRGLTSLSQRGGVVKKYGCVEVDYAKLGLNQPNFVKRSPLFYPK